MKLIVRNFLIVLSALLLTSCGDDAFQAPPGFNIVWNKANIFFVHLEEGMTGEKSAQRNACTALCDSKGYDECEVYMWSKKELIPEGLPIRNAGSFIHSYFKRDSAGKKTYKCLECE